MTGRGRFIEAVSWFLLANLLIIRYFKPIVSIFALFSFRLWIDWLLLAIFLFGSRRRAVIGALGYVILAVSAVLVVHNLVHHGLGDFGLIEAANILLVLSVPLFYATLMNALPEDAVFRHLRGLLFTLNIYFVLNTPLIFLQFLGIVPVASAFLEENQFVPDHLTGLIGLNGVSTLNFIWLATIAGNVWFSRASRKARYMILAGAQLLLATVISALNDNKMFLITVLAASIVFLAVNFRALGKWVLIALVVAILALPLLVTAIESTFTTASGASLDLFSVVIFDPSFAPNPNNERAFINDLAFRYYGAFEFGAGLGHVNDLSEEVHEHLGINSASLILIQGGIPLLVASTGVLFVGLRSILRDRSALAGLGILALSIALMYASNPIADRYTLIAVCLFLVYLNSVKPGQLVRPAHSGRTLSRSRRRREAEVWSYSPTTKPLELQPESRTAVRPVERRRRTGYRAR